MLYTEDFSMHHYVGFSQIGSQIVSVLMSVCVCVFVCVCLPLRLLITGGVMWSDMDLIPYIVLRKFRMAYSSDS